MEEKTPQERPTGRVGLPIVVARIVIVLGIATAAALGLFLLIGGVWQLGLPALAATLVFIFLMFFLERGAEGDAES